MVLLIKMMTMKNLAGKIFNEIEYKAKHNTCEQLIADEEKPRPVKDKCNLTQCYAHIAMHQPQLMQLFQISLTVSEGMSLSMLGQFLHSTYIISTLCVPLIIM